jgi:hypothetical protein
MEVSVNASRIAATIFPIMALLAGPLSAQTAVSLLTCSPSRLFPGETAACTLTLSQAAPASGTEVALSSPNQSLIPSSNSVTVSAGATSTTFTVTTAAIFTNETAVLSAAALHSVSLRWNASDSPNLSYYNLYRGTISGGPYPVVTAVGLMTTFTDSNVQAGQTYYYVVTAVDATGAESAYSNEASAGLPNDAPQTAALSLCASRQTGVTVPLRCGALPLGSAN